MSYADKQHAAPLSVVTSPGKKQQEPIAVQSKVAKIGKQSGDKLAAGTKRSLESDESDSEDDDDDQKTPALKKQKPTPEGLYFNILVNGIFSDSR